MIHISNMYNNVKAQGALAVLLKLTAVSDLFQLLLQTLKRAALYVFFFFPPKTRNVKVLIAINKQAMDWDEDTTTRHGAWWIACVRM